jgi:hypothetical protein
MVAPCTPPSSIDLATRSVSGRPTLPSFPPYDHVEACTPDEIWALMQSYTSRCETILDEHTARLDAAHARPARWHGVTWTHSPDGSRIRPRANGESLGKVGFGVGRVQSHARHATKQSERRRRKPSSQRRPTTPRVHFASTRRAQVVSLAARSHPTVKDDHVAFRCPHAANGYCCGSRVGHQGPPCRRSQSSERAAV